MPIEKLSSMTWEEARGLDRGRVVAILPVGATEAHGPHLPLDTDVIIAEAMAEAGAERLAVRGYVPLLLPTLAYTAAPFAAGFPGTISLRPETTTALVVDVGRSLAARGFRTLAVANAHLDPAHIAALHDAGAELDDALTFVFPDVTRRPWGGRLTDEFRSGACHAGRYEGSIVLARRPEHVHERIRETLPPVPVSLSDAMRAGRRTFEEAGGDRAYFGDPAAATAEEGERSIAALGGIIEDAVVAALGNGEER